MIESKTKQYDLEKNITIRERCSLMANEGSKNNCAHRGWETAYSVIWVRWSKLH